MRFLAAVQGDATLDFDSRNDVQIQFIDEDDFPLANFTELQASDHEFYSDESELSSEDSIPWVPEVLFFFSQGESG